MRSNRPVIIAAVLAIAGLCASTISAAAQTVAAPSLAPLGVTYADLADLSDSAPLVVRVQVRKLTPLEPERARGVRAGWGRFYVEAKTRALISGNAVLGGALRYLVDLPLDSRRKPPAVKGKEVLIFARPVAQRPGELQLVAPDAQIVWDAAVEARLRGVLTELHQPDAPKRIKGLREVIHVPGNLAGEGETQMFLMTADNSAASIIVAHKPGQPSRWGVTFSEVLGDSLEAPARETLAWYRLACFMPAQLPQGVNLSGSPDDMAIAGSDYAFVRRSLGACPRSRR